MTTSTLIPRRKLFDNPSAMGAYISPDGRWLSWLAPVDGVMNIWLSPSDNSKAAQPLTRTKGRPIHSQMWSQDSRHVLFTNDETGDENHHLFAVDPKTAILRDLTPLKDISVQINILSPDRPGEIVVGLNDRDARWHDLYVIDIASGARTLIWENRQDLNEIGLDWQLRPRWARSALPAGGSQLWRIEGAELKPWLQVPYEDDLTTWPLAFNRAGTQFWMRSSLGHDAMVLKRIDWASGAETAVIEAGATDVVDQIWNPQTFEIEAASSNRLRQHWFHVAPDLAADMALLFRELPGFEFSVTSLTDDNRRWTVEAFKAEQPATYFLFDRDKAALTELFRARPALASYRLAPMRAIEAKSRDGLDLVSYLTLPVSETGTRPAKPLPMVLNVHGGPWGRDSYGYNREHQWLANRGYAVLSVNYRGSTGFGKAFIAASEKQHGAKMHDDLIDMVNWAIAEGIADKDRVAIFGASYGGYASFLGATITPDVFCCAVPVVGITNLQTLLESIPPYWTGFNEFMFRSYGDPRTEEGRALLADRSPIHKVDRIKKPMLIFHGANDVRCKVVESDTIVAAMQAKGIPVTYVVYPDEGHGFAKPGNRIAYYALAEAFFARHLGGACEAMGEDLASSSHEVRANPVSGTSGA